MIEMQPVNAAELQSVEGGWLPLLIGLAVLLYATAAY